MEKRRPFFVRAAAAALVCAASTAISTIAWAESAAEFYKGKNVTLVIPAGPGGSYGRYGLLGKAALEKFMPGVTIVMQYMPGSGGAKSTNYIFGAAPRDGSVIVNIEGAATQTQLFRPARVSYDMAKLNFIGQYAPAPAIISVWHSAAAKTFDDAKKTEVVLGATGKGSQQYQIPFLLNALVGTKFKIITGYKGSRGIFHAIETGEVQGGLASTVSWATIKPDWVPKKMVVPLFQTGAKAAKGYEHVPLVEDVAKNPDQRMMLRIATSGAVMGRSLAAPPGIPADRLRYLRDAFKKGMADPEMEAMAKKLRLPVEYASGEDLGRMARDILATPRPIVEKAKTILSVKD